MKKIVVKVSVGDETRRQKVLEAVAKLKGIKDMSIDIEKGTLTIIGGVDPVCVIKRLKKCGGGMIDSVGDPPKPDDKDKDKDKDKKTCDTCLPPCPLPCKPCPPPCPLPCKPCPPPCPPPCRPCPPPCPPPCRSCPPPYPPCHGEHNPDPCVIV